MRISDWSSDVCSSDLSKLSLGPSRRRAEPDLFRTVLAARGRIGDPEDIPEGDDDPEGQHHQQTPGGGPCEAVDQPADQRPAEHSAQQFGQHPVSEPVIRSEEHTSELQSLMRNSYA